MSGDEYVWPPLPSLQNELAQQIEELRIKIANLEAENDGLRRALDETHAELVRLERAAQY